MKFRAKLAVVSVTDNGHSDSVKFETKYSENAEDNSFSAATPSGGCSLDITNPNLRGKIKPGATFYVDFTPVE